MRAIVLILAAALCCGSVHAAVPHQVNYQGYLAATGGTPVNATVSMAFKLYADPSGPAAALHTETQIVVVTNGVFSVLLGAEPANLLVLPFDVPYWLGVKVGTDAEMAPRQALAAAPYAIRAASAESATKLAAARTINGVAFDGTANIARPDFACASGTFITGFNAGQPVCSPLPDIIFLQGFGTQVPYNRALDMDTAAVVIEPSFALVQGEAGWDGCAMLAGPLAPLASGTGAPTKSACQAMFYPPQNGGIWFPDPLQFACVKTSQGRFGYLQFISGVCTPTAVVNWTTWQ